MHVRPSGWLQPAIGLGLIGACVACEAALLRVGIDDLDEGYFVQQATRVLHGQLPYRDFNTLYTPGLVSLHALLFWAVGGPYLLVPRALALATRAALALVLYALARPLVRQPLWAAAPGLFLLLGLDDAPERWEPHPGWLSTLFAVLAAWCLGRAPATRWLVGAGLAAGLAYLFKQNTGVFSLAATMGWGAFASSASRAARHSLLPPEQRKRMLVPLVAFVAVTLVWLVPLIMALDGQIALLGGFVGAVNQAGLSSPPESSIVLPLLCLVAGVWLVRWGGAERRLQCYLLAGSALFATQYPRMDTLHLAWSAPLLLVVGAVALDRVRPFAVSLILVVGAFALTWPLLPSRLALIGQPLAPISKSVSLASDLRVPPRTASDIEGVVADIQGRTLPGEPIFVYPTSPLLYVLAERPNPTQFDHLNPGAATSLQIQSALADLEASRVKLVVISDYWQTAWGPPGPNAPLLAWLETRFTPVATYGAYRVLSPGL